MHTVTLATKPHLKRWVEIKFGTPAELPKCSLLRIGVMSVMKKRYYGDHQPPNLTERVMFRLSKSQLTKHGHSLSPENTRELNNLLNEYMQLDMTLFVNYCRNDKMTVQEALDLYRDRFGWTEEMISSEAMRHAYFRENLKVFQFVALNTDPNVQRQSIRA